MSEAEIGEIKPSPPSVTDAVMKSAERRPYRELGPEERGLDAGSVALPGLLDSIDWPYVSDRFRAVDFDFGLRTTDPGIGAYLGDVFRDMTVGGRPSRWYSLFDRGDGTKPRWGLYLNDEEVTASANPKGCIGRLVWHINRQVILSTEDKVLIHAAAAERDGSAVVLAAPMESGKTTLVAGLVMGGLRYITDEAVAIDPASGLIHAYPKALSIDPGSWEVLEDLSPTLDVAERDLSPRQWQVPVSRIRSDAVASVAEPRLILTPRYDPSQKTEATPVSRAEMLSLLAQSTFEFERGPVWKLRVLSEMVRQCDSYRVTISSLDAGRDLVLDLLDQAVSRNRAV